MDKKPEWVCEKHQWLRCIHYQFMPFIKRYCRLKPLICTVVHLRTMGKCNGIFCALKSNIVEEIWKITGIQGVP